MGKPYRNNYRNKLKWWYDLRRYLARKAKEAAPPPEE